MVGFLATAVFAWTNPTLAPPSGNAPVPINVSGMTQTKTGGLDLATTSGSVGIGYASPTYLFAVGPSAQFQVDGSGNMLRVNNIQYTWPSAQGGASTVLRNDGSGNLSWQAVSSGDGMPPLLVTRANVHSNDALATKDAACISEFGSDYYAAPGQALGVYMRMGSMDSEKLNTADAGVSFDPFADLSNRFNRILGTTFTTAKLLCIWKKAPILFTRTALLATTSLASKDIQCTSEFGAAYQTATPADVVAHAHMGMSGSSNTFNTTDSSSYVFTADTTNDFNYVTLTGAGSYPVACIRKG